VDRMRIIFIPKGFTAIEELRDSINTGVNTKVNKYEMSTIIRMNDGDNVPVTMPMLLGGDTPVHVDCRNHEIK